MEKSNLNTKRNYQIVTLEMGEIRKPFTQSLESLLKSNYEYAYALSDVHDGLLDLKVGESMYFQPNRDDDKSKAIILRVK